MDRAGALRPDVRMAYAMAVLRLAGVGVSAGSGGPVAGAGGVDIGPGAIIALSTQARSVAAASAAQAMLPVAAALTGG